MRGREWWRVLGVLLGGGLALLIVGWPVVGDSAPTGSPSGFWARNAPASSPPARAGAVAAYDGATTTVVLFGGEVSTNGPPFGDTWTWNGLTWQAENPTTSPPARVNASAAYDPATRTVVLFGGDANGTSLGDTWLWDGTTWQQATPVNAPPAREGASLVYDASTQKLVLFGGATTAPATARSISPAVTSTLTYLNDTWLWDGSTWTAVAPAAAPSARAGASVAYDPTQAQVILFGGTDGTSSLGDTWLWDGTNWTALSGGNAPAPRSGAGFAYDAAIQASVLIGGTKGGTALADTWLWNGTAWAPLATYTQPAPRSDAALAYDAITSRVVLFGGNGSQPSFLGDTWTFRPWPSGNPVPQIALPWVTQ